MLEIKGKYTSARFIADDTEHACIEQIRHICDLDVMKGASIRVMADVCPAIGTTIGSTFTYDEYVLPSLVSGDIGCGIITVKLNTKRLEPAQIDRVVRENLIDGKKSESVIERHSNNIDLRELHCAKYVDVARCTAQLSELGGGNHFIEFDKGSDGYVWLTVHSGSRLLGQQIYDYYIEKGDMHNTRIFSALSGNIMKSYLHDADIAKKFAAENRYTIIDILCKMLKVKVTDEYHSVHNYVDTEQKIIRKGAISAMNGERVVIPISASPVYGGVIIGKGIGSEDWNLSAPHGAGRICSRSRSRDMFTVSDFKKSMDGVYSKNINQAGLSEAPLVYRRREYIVESLKELVEVEEILTPFYNFKN